MKNLYFEIRNTLRIRERQNLRLIVKPIFETARERLEKAPLSFIIQIPEPLIRKGIKDRDNDVFIYLYEELFPKVKSYVQRNKGNSEIAEDIFQETMIDIIGKSDNGTLNPTKSVKGYIVTVAINKWKNANRKNNRFKKSLVETEDNFTDEKYNLEDSTGIIDQLEPTDNHDIVSIWLDELSDKCKSIVNERIYKNKKWEAVAAELGYKDAKSARTQGHKCIERLREYKNSKRFGLLGDASFITIYPFKR
jgi:RNA polymerase sigma factor (sigma-70 family)